MIKLLSKNGNLIASSLVRTIPELTSDQVQKLFGHGAGKKTQKNLKYSDSLVIKHEDSGELYTLYMSYGVWRLGGYSCDPAPDYVKQVFNKYKYCTFSCKNVDKVVDYLLTA